MPELNSTFFCSRLAGTLSHATCIKRQSVAQVQQYLECAACPEGATICAGAVPGTKSKQLGRWAKTSNGNKKGQARKARKKAALNHALQEGTC